MMRRAALLSRYQVGSAHVAAPIGKTPQQPFEGLEPAA
jgi:hypothetical protein